MMEAMRRGATGWIAKILMGLLILSFAVWGVADVFTGYGQRSLAKIGDTEIAAEQFQNALQLELNVISRQIGRRLTNEQAHSFGIDARVLSRLIGGAAIDAHARNLGLAVPDSAVAEAIRTDPNFQGATGQFDRALFNEMLRQNGISENAYFADRKAGEAREQLTGALRDSVTAPKTPVDIIYRYREETRTVAYVTLDPEKAANAPEPTSEQLKDYYEQNKRAFMAPEYRKLSVLFLTTDEVKKLVSVQDADIRAAYERSKESFNDPEKRRIDQLSFTGMAAAEKAHAELAAAKNFEEGAKTLGYKESDYELGLLSRSELIDKTVADAAFGLEPGEISRPIQGRFANVILRVREVQPGKQRTFEDVRAQIADRLALEQSRGEVQTLHDKIDDERGAGKSLKEIADNLRLGFVEVEATDRNGKTPDGKPALEHTDAQGVLRSAFEGGAGIERDGIELQNGYAWIDVAGSTPERQKPFEEIEAEVKSQWVGAETKKAIAAAADAIVARHASGESLDAIAKDRGLTLETSKPFKRNAQMAALTPAGVRRAFALAKGSAASVETSDGKSRSIIVVTQITPAPPPSKQRTDQLASELTRELQADALTSYVAALQDRFGVSVNQTVLRRTLGIDQQP